MGFPHHLSFNVLYCYTDTIATAVFPVQWHKRNREQDVEFNQLIVLGWHSHSTGKMRDVNVAAPPQGGDFSALFAEKYYPTLDITQARADGLNTPTTSTRSWNN